MGIFSSRNNQSPGDNPMLVTHELMLEGKCPVCRETVTLTTTAQTFMGQSGTASGVAVCCGTHVPVSTQF
jgi:hypothetical protein